MTDIGILVIRVFSGVLMVLLHGWTKMVGIFYLLNGKEWKFVDTVANIGFPLPVLFAILVGLIEFLGGIMVTVGLFTKISSILLSLVMLIATYHNIRIGAPFELSLLYLGIFITLSLTSAGRFSLDNYIRKR
ncbi:MAG: DoxX family protein [Brevinematales bacterium]|nr:DoxX family protein [Brevinematales bacterium]